MKKAILIILNITVYLLPILLFPFYMALCIYCSGQSHVVIYSITYGAYLLAFYIILAKSYIKIFRKINKYFS